MSAFYGETDEQESIAAIRRALAIGITFLDTADLHGEAFGENERLVGRAIAGRRDEVVPSTTFGNALNPVARFGPRLADENLSRNRDLARHVHDLAAAKGITAAQFSLA